VGRLPQAFGKFWHVAPNHAGIPVLPTLVEDCNTPQPDWVGVAGGFSYFYTENCKEIFPPFTASAAPSSEQGPAGVQRPLPSGEVGMGRQGNRSPTLG